MNSKIIMFETFTKEGKEFIEMWNNSDRDGAQNIIAKHFGIAIPTVYRIRKKLGLIDLHSKEHPGKKALYSRIRKLYYEHQSTARVGQIVGMSSQNINQILRSMNVSLGPQHIVSILSVKPKNGMHIHAFLKRIKELHYEGKTTAEIAKILGCDQGTVSKRLKVLGLSLTQNHKVVPGGYPCLWCGKIMEKVWIARGVKKQVFCSSRCKNRSKDYRKYANAAIVLERFDKELKKSWGEEWSIKRQEILDRTTTYKLGGKK